MFILHKKKKPSFHHPHPCLSSPLSSPLLSVPSSSLTLPSSCSLHHNHANCPSNRQTVNFVINSKFTFQFSWINLATSILWIYLVLCTLHLRTSFALSSSDRHHHYSRSTPLSSPICRQDRSQCSSQQESDYYESGGFRLDTILGDPMRRVSTEFNDYTRKFDELIKELLAHSENGFHTMFTRTYGQRYEKHSRLFSNMFTLLNKYYSYNNVNLDSEFTKFFTDLYQKIFLEFNNQYIFGEDYLKCVASHMETINPFGDIPRKLVIEVQRSFTAARVFIQSLVTASEISKTVAEHSATPNCHKFFVQMNYCQQCEDSPDRIPCRNYCNAVMHTCTASYRSLNKEWNPFLDKLTAIISRLETSFNIESVVGPLDIKISEAIMNFQENGITVSKRLYSFCGKPKRGKRLAINRKPTSDTSSTLDNRSPTASKSPLDNFLDSTKKQLKKMKDFWHRLPETVCNNSVIPATMDGSAEINNKPCWSQEDGSMQPLTDKGSEMIEKVDFINSQRALLRNVNSKLDAAFRGSDIPEDEDLSGSGSGSGDGDYDDDYIDDYNDNDDEDDDVPKSSTASPVSSVSPVTMPEKGNSSTTGDDVNKTKPSSTKADNVTNIPITNATNNQLYNPATPKGSSSLVEKSSLMIVSLTFLSILIGQTL